MSTQPDFNQKAKAETDGKIPRDAVLTELASIIASAAFGKAERPARFLRHLVQKTLRGESHLLKESVLGMDVFERPASWDPSLDPIVRQEAARLRKRLAKYYANGGAADEVTIELPVGSYVPVFRRKTVEAGVAPMEARPAVKGLEPRRRWRTWKAVAVGTVAGAIIAAIIPAPALWRSGAHQPTTAASIAVLPFLNLSGDPADDYLGDGISEELTESLAEFGNLQVVARTSAFQYKGKSGDVREIGRNLRAGAVLEGSVARRGGQLHVIAQLIRTSDGYHLWSHTYDATLADLPPVEDGIASATREQLAPSPEIAAREVSTARNPEAHDLYIRAAYDLNRRTPASTREAIALAGQAAEKDPSFAQPYVVMAAGEAQLNTLLAQAPHGGAERAWEDIAKALALDPGNSGAHAQKALLAYTDQWNWPQAEREFGVALASGSHGSAENLYGWCLMTRGRFDEARGRLQLAAELDPLSLGPQLNQVEESIAERNYAAAREQVERILQTAPANPVALALGVSTAFWQRDCPAAAAWDRRLWATFPKAIGERLSALDPDALCEHPATAKTALWQDPPPGYSSPYRLAAIYAVGGDAGRALSYLEKSAELREPVLLELRVDRSFDSIRRDPRLIALERRIGLLD